MIATEALLLLRNPIAAHPIPRIIDLADHILRRHISGTHDTDPNGDGCAVSTEPSPRSLEHDGRRFAILSVSLRLASVEEVILKLAKERNA